MVRLSVCGGRSTLIPPYFLPERRMRHSAARRPPKRISARPWRRDRNRCRRWHESPARIRLKQRPGIPPAFAAPRVIEIAQGEQARGRPAALGARRRPVRLFQRHPASRVYRIEHRFFVGKAHLDLTGVHIDIHSLPGDADVQNALRIVSGLQTFFISLFQAAVQVRDRM
jgi:hypothetical protein